MLSARLRLLIAALAPLALPAQGVTVRDSAGIRIVENLAVLGTALAAPESWRLGFPLAGDGLDRSSRWSA
jgi:hypothetical protein